MTEKRKNLAQRIIGIMADVDYIQKESKRVNNQYRFVSHDAVAAKIHPLLVKHGVAIFPTVKDCTIDGNRTQLTLECELVNADDPTDTKIVCVPGLGIDPQDKGPGKAMSYAYKTLLLKLFVLEAGEEDNEVRSRPHQREAAPRHELAKGETDHAAPILNDLLRVTNMRQLNAVRQRATDKKALFSTEQRRAIARGIEHAKERFESHEVA